MADYNTVLPYNKEAEQSVLGSILIDSSCMAVALQHLKADDFYLEEHKKIFAAMVTMYGEKGNAIDAITIADVLEKDKDFNIATDARSYVWELAKSVPSTANIEKYAEIVKEQFYLRALIGLSNKINGKISEGSVDAKVLLEETEQAIYDLRQGTDNKGPRPIKDVIINGVYDKLNKLNSDEADLYKGIPTGFGALDKITTGMNRSDLVLIGARPAMGKTSFALNLAHNLAVGAGKKVVFFSLEMTNEQLAERLLSSQSGIESKKFRTGELNDDEWVRLGNAASSFYNTELYLDDSSSITVPEMKSRVRRLRNVDAVIVDYLGLIQSAVKKENRVNEVQEITKNLKMMAKDLNIPVICCAQLSRATEGRGKSHRPQLSDLRESGSIEQDADIVMFLYREVYYSGEKTEEEQEDIDKAKTELIVAKNRHGETGTVDLVFDSEFTRFRAIDNVSDYREN